MSVPGILSRLVSEIVNGSLAERCYETSHSDTIDTAIEIGELTFRVLSKTQGLQQTHFSKTSRYVKLCTYLLPCSDDGSPLLSSANRFGFSPLAIDST